MRAEQPVPYGERSILPGSMATAFRPLTMPSSRPSGPATWQNEKWAQSGCSGWENPSCWFAAAVMQTPSSAISRASEGQSSKPSPTASTMTKLSPP